jgi:hypothetical protein
MIKLLPLLCCAVLPLAAGCTTQGAHDNDHWSQRSISNSMRRAFTGYEPERDGTPEAFRENEFREFTLGARRYFFHHNPDNPFEMTDPAYDRRWYPNSQPPDKVNDDSSAKYAPLYPSTSIRVVEAPKSASSLRTAVGLTQPTD